ncbi:phage tail protein [Hapalosiphon sp. MRB220]|nr:phage tail protein [Hapalosiphon sp. MRB220]
MPNYLAPGVYIEEVEPLARPIAGVGTSTAGFIGVVPNNVDMPLKPGSETEKQKVAPANEPQLITSWEQFKNNFGDFQASNSTLAHAVYGFFNNGGTRCWVIRVAASSNLTNLADALEKFKPIDEIAMVAVPGVTSKTQQEAIIDHCTDMKDRVAILDGTANPSALTADAIKGATSGENGAQPTKDSDYASLYFPWINVSDPASGNIISQPPSGHIAGVYARVDGERGVFKAPANEVIRGVVSLGRQLSRADQGELNQAGINVIRAFNGNMRIWGARTLGGDNNDIRYISTRRYLNFLRESIDAGTQFVVFEPNNPGLWQRIKRSVGDFLLNQWRDGALFGETPAQAFFVKCDAETNPPEVRELGQVVTEIGVAIVKPAEFVIFRIQQTTGG